MRTRKTFAVLGAGLMLACCVMIYLVLDLSLFPQGRKQLVKDNQWLHFENRLAKLEKDVSRHHVAVSALQEATQSKNEAISRTAEERPYFQGLVHPAKPQTCSFNLQKVPEVDIQMLELYKKLQFDNVDGGAWKQGWKIAYNVKQWHPNRKLKVFVVPHSHNDPGWLNTFEKYYTSQTKGILNNMVRKLAEDMRRKFIWAEVSFFKLWWDEQSKNTRDIVKQLIHDGQLEIVAGGWVMPDEAVSHWVAQLAQLTEGHQWLKANLDYAPNSGWAIDPFGLSPTMPYLLKGAGLENLLIQRVHYSVKKRLAKEKNLEFRWRQLWDNDGSTELFTHMMPFYSYDVPHTCGPDPKICCQFDFYRLPNFGLTCPWRVPPRAITNANVAERAMLLLDQYRKKAQLFKTDVLLVPLGDDFRYAHFTEWEAQYDNYQKLFDYMNGNKQLNVDIQFGTLSDYFDAVRDKRKMDQFPTLSGDFFTYSDRDDHYWSGYYTSRPFHKRLDRVLLGALRGSEVLSTIAWTKGNDQLIDKNITSRLSVARKWHSLFQHHDGITGTARDNVVVDYAQKMITALENSAHVLQQAIAHVLKTPQGSVLDVEAAYFSMDETRSHHSSVGERHVLTVEEITSPVRKVVLYNALPRRRTNIQTLIVSSPFVRVTDHTGHAIPCQISPVWVGPAALSAARYELSFPVTVPGFGLATYVIHAVRGTSLPREVYLAKVTIFNTAISPSTVPGFADLKTLPSMQDISISHRPNLSAAFGKYGLLKAISADDITVPIHLSFVKYGTRGVAQDRSGAYLFLPDKQTPDLVSVDDNRIVHLVTGPILSRVYTQLENVRHTCTLFNSSGSDGLGLQILNEVDISETQNYELAMRLDTDIASGDQFFTDLNGLDMIRRQRFPKLPIQGNYYPLPAAAYIEDKRVRLTVATAQPLGVASMVTGQIEIMQDRRLVQDDNRGLGQGVTDNLLTNHLFTLVLEKRRTSCPNEKPATDHPAGMLSLGGHLASEQLLYPMVAMHPSPSLKLELNAHFSPLRFDLPVDLSVVSLRIFPVPEGAGEAVGMVLHRQAVDLCWGNDALSQHFNISQSGEIDLSKFISSVEDWTISEAPLTFNSVGSSLKSPIVNLCPQQILSILFHKTQS